MRTWHPILLAAALFACGGEKDTDAPTGPNVDNGGDADTDADTDSDTDTDVDCDASIIGVFPAPNAVDVPLDTTVSVDFDVAVPSGGSWSLTVTDATGSAALAADGLSATWTPDTDLMPDTMYTIEAEVCGTADSSPFTTAPPPVDIADVQGNAYGLAWADVTITQPTVGAALKALIPIDFVLLQLENIDPVTDAVDAAATLAYFDAYSNVVPDCDVAVEEVADFSANPFFSFGPQPIQLVINASTGAVADIENMEITAQLSADGTQLLNPTLSGLVATEQFIPKEDCATGSLVSYFGPTCLPCSISASGQCMLVEGHAAFANIQPGIDLYATCGL